MYFLLLLKFTKCALVKSLPLLLMTWNKSWPVTQDTLDWTHASGVKDFEYMLTPFTRSEIKEWPGTLHMKEEANKPQTKWNSRSWLCKRVSGSPSQGDIKGCRLLDWGPAYSRLNLHQARLDLLCCAYKKELYKLLTVPGLWSTVYVYVCELCVVMLNCEILSSVSLKMKDCQQSRSSRLYKGIH